MPRVAAHSDSEESVKEISEPIAEQNGVEEEEAENTSEYEIEEVLKAKRGIFPDVRAISISTFL
jgi:hypothetical protein